MSKNFKRLFSVLMVVAMVTAMAAACSGKDETTETDDSKTETTVAEDDEKDAQQEDANRPPDEEDTSNDKGGAPKTENDQLTPEDVEALKASIRNSVTTRYLEPNGMTADQIVWPEDWTDFYLLLTECTASVSLGMEVEIDRKETTTNVLEAAFLGVLDWLDTQGEYNIGYLDNTNAVLQPWETVIPEIVVEIE